LPAVHTVCHIITKLELGGAQEVALFTVAHLDRTRFRPILVTGPGGMLTEEARALPGVEVVIVPSLAREIRPFRDLWALVVLARLLRKVRPAIVHTHSSKAGILGRWAAWLAGVPAIIHTIHGFGITPSQPAWLRHLLVGVERLTSLVTTHWVAVAQADIEAGLGWGLFVRSRVSLIRPGIDPGPYQASISASDRERVRAELGAGPTDALVGMVACLKPQKAPLDFVRVAERVCAERPAARFVLVGDGDLRAPVERRIREAGLEARVRLVGWRRDIPAVMRALDVLLLTSRWEGLARVLLEARARGLPVVATNVGGAAEAIVEGTHGWLCEPGDVDAEADRVCRVLDEAGRRGGLGLNGGDVPAEFDIHQMVRQYEELYGKLLAFSTF
jgi:glycosyltransferase involved in cell wall biosynthesis